MSSVPTPVKPVEQPNPRLYSPFSLRIYDTVVQKFSHRYVWRCPYRMVQSLYERVGRDHLEVGPGTGSTLARIPRSRPVTDLYLLDLNPACLVKTQQRVGRRFDTHLYEAGALAQWPLAEASVDSVAASDVVHCLPGESVWDKRALVDNAARVLREGGTLFGSTFLGELSIAHTRTARRLLRLYNGQRNTMHNEGDTFIDLARLLLTHPDFTDVWVEPCGSVALFSATRAPRLGGEQA